MTEGELKKRIVSAVKSIKIRAWVKPNCSDWEDRTFNTQIIGVPEEFITPLLDEAKKDLLEDTTGNPEIFGFIAIDYDKWKKWFGERE